MLTKDEWKKLRRRRKVKARSKMEELA